MNSYLICPKGEVYSKLISDYAGRDRAGSGRRALQKDGGSIPTVICCLTDFKNETFKNKFQNPSYTDTIFIVPELNWEHDYSIDLGYKIALELITSKLSKNRFVRILFVSLFTQEQILLMVSDEYAEMVKSFPHISLFDIIDAENMVPIPVYSDIHFELLKRVVVSKSGQLDYIKHRLSHLTHIDSKTIDKDIQCAKQNMCKILDLLSLPYFGGDNAAQANKILEYRDEIKNADSKDTIIGWVATFRQFIDEIKGHYYKNTDDTLNTCNIVYKVLIVEDYEYYRDRLTVFFKKYLGPKTKVTAIGNTEEMRKLFQIKDKIDERTELKKKRRQTLKEEKSRKESVKEYTLAGKFDIVILDMMYNTNGKEEGLLADFNGFDLYKSLRAAETNSDVKKAAVRIVTALPRNDISRLVKKYFKTETPVVFTKGNDWEQLEGCLLDRMDEILDECSSNEDSFLKWKYYPKTGIFRHPGMYETIVDSNEELFINANEYAQKVVLSEEKMNNCSLVNTKDPQKVLSHLNTIMAFRRLVIKFLRSDLAPTSLYEKTNDDDNIEDKESYSYYDEDCFRVFLRRYGIAQDARYDKGFLQTKLGFKVKKYFDPQKDSSTCYTAIIDLMDYYQFFKGELDSLADENDYKALADYIQFVRTQLDINKSRKMEAVYDKSGLSSYINNKEKDYVSSFSKMLDDVYKYVSDSNEDFFNRNSLHHIFVANFDLRDEPNKRIKIENCAKDIIDKLDMINDMEF